ncbi:MAG: peptidylprolyl isomerase [Planctomycetota bacterium]|jgi:parvulin-like peptidyl-prolyl isomerase
MCRTVAITLCLALLAGCDGAGTAARQLPPPAAGQQPTTGQAPAAQPGEREVMAYVNGKPVYMDALYRLLLKGPGSQFAIELVRHEMVRQAAQKNGISISKEEFDAGHERFLEAAFPGLDSAADRELALNELLLRKQVSREQWDMSIRTAALLRRIVAPDIEVSDQELRDEFGRQYGRRVVVSHIETADLSEAQKVKRLAAKEDFAQLAATYSTNRSARSGGRLPPIGPKTEGVPPAIRQAALAMKKVGEISDPVQVGTTFHVLKLDQVIEPEKVKFEDVRDKLLADLKERRIRLFQRTMLVRLSRQAEVKYVNPVLKARHAAERRGNLP